MSKEKTIFREDKSDNIIEKIMIKPGCELRITRWKKLDQVEMFITETDKKLRRTTSIVLETREELDFLRSVLGMKA
jgi:hypothetical protein